MAQSTYPFFCSAEALFTDVSSTQASVCKKSGEAGVANMEAAGLNRNTMVGPWSDPTTGRRMISPQSQNELAPAFISAGGQYFHAHR